MKKVFLLISIVFSIQILSAQTGVIRGTVIDIQSEMPIIGATVQLLDENNQGTVTDIDGSFTISQVPLGRNVIVVNFLGYETLTLPNIDVTRGKDVLLDISLRESITELEEVVIVAESVKDQAQNEMATISARQFSVEEINRYSGGRSDVARLASNFAGVSAPDDSRNDIVIRGNSPTGVLWRIEGIPIPSPNHFSTLGTTGSPVSAVNPNVLKNSDFITSAFPAEYGNANAGVFDLGFRNGNKERAEYTLQVGAFSGFEGMAEGKLGNKGGSYLVAGRYSFVGIVGAGITSAVPDYQDISFKIDLGNSPFGRFSVFGIGGRSQIDFLGDEIDEGDLFAAEDEDSFVNGSFGVVGLKHNYLVNDKTYIRTVIGGSFRENTFVQDRALDPEVLDNKSRYTEADTYENRFTISSYLNTKLSAKQTFRAGVLYERFGQDALLRDRDGQPDRNGDGEPDWFTVFDFDGGFDLIQPYAQSMYRIDENLDLNVGLHGQYSSLNEQFVIEPRASLSYKLGERQKLTMGYGIHHQNLPLPILFLNEEVGGELVRTNADLNFLRSDHYVLAYDVRLATNWRLKAEVYHQEISNAAVDAFSSSYSTLTEGAGFVFADDKTSLVNEGSGFNRGVEVTLEKFYSNGFHMLVTTSIFESKYQGSDGIERSTPFDNGYVLNVLMGREFKIGKEKNNAFVIDTKFTTSGGRWYTPVDLERSRMFGTEVLQEELAFTQQYDDYLRWDLKFGLKINSKKKRSSHQLFFDFQNVTNRSNIFARQYNRVTNNIDQVDQIGFFPDFLYRYQF